MAGLADQTTFSKFADLPLEIRRMIWKLALPGPRVVNIVQKPITKPIPGSDFPYAPIEEVSKDESWFARPFGFRSKSLPPQILFVCRESYEVASEYYEQAFSCYGSYPETYFDFCRDTLYIQCHNFGHFHRDRNMWGMLRNIGGDDVALGGAECLDISLGSAENLQRVENLAVMMQRPGEAAIDYNGWLCSLFKEFCGLKKFTLVVEDYTPFAKQLGLAKDVERIISLTEPIDVYQTFTDYQRFRRHLDDPPPHETQFPAVTPHKKANMTDVINVEWLEKTMAKHGYSDWIMPEIECKIAIPNGLRKELEEQRDKCERKQRLPPTQSVRVNHGLRTSRVAPWNLPIWGPEDGVLVNDRVFFSYSGLSSPDFYPN